MSPAARNTYQPIWAWPNRPLTPTWKTDRARTSIQQPPRTDSPEIISAAEKYSLAKLWAKSESESPDAFDDAASADTKVALDSSVVIDSAATSEPGDDAGTAAVSERKAAIDEDVDAMLDEIDEVLETNAEEFVRGFVQKGGQ